MESLLESTKESADTLQDIGFNEKSETRVLIEKFVEENPEAAASLLRNWLNEEWSRIWQLQITMAFRKPQSC